MQGCVGTYAPRAIAKDGDFGQSRLVRHVWRQSRFHPEAMADSKKVLIALQVCQRNWSTGFVSYTSYSMESLRWHAKVFDEELQSTQDIFAALQATEAALATRYTRNSIVAILRTTKNLVAAPKTTSTPLNSPVTAQLPSHSPLADKVT